MGIIGKPVNQPHRFVSRRGRATVAGEQRLQPRRSHFPALRSYRNSFQVVGICRNRSYHPVPEST